MAPAHQSFESDLRVTTHGDDWLVVHFGFARNERVGCFDAGDRFFEGELCVVAAQAAEFAGCAE